ncbi:PAQR family membrane homeostasis protein TrhA [Oceanobacillus jeddahense]|uniref:Hemolysin III family protein n=1 Tax=Oceanobacillus jeddahense TaxID=1462527 RepID=A0ABY5JQB3_9BACI|nr:hemolysin III family protein [Oceanobacillus jeddahense]UUI01999.1 hemolysin III family protein [Oceanobacillus jeddahense]
MNKFIREPMNAFTHFIGIVLSITGLILLVVKAARVGTPLDVGAVAAFGVSLILLYTASTVYHSVIAGPKTIAFFRRLDHAMIYVLIAGTYIPLCLISLQGTTGWVLFWVVTGLAFLGILFKLIWFHSPRWLSTLLYVLMGWIAVFYSGALAPIIGVGGMFFLIAGGILYTIGAVIYWLKPEFLRSRYFGYHEIFHIFILLGSLGHFLCIYLYVI